MAVSRRAQIRLLDRDELELVDRSRGEALSSAGHADLVSLRSLIRERRDRARSLAQQQRREMRRKAEPRGARAATGNAGTVAKHDVLTSALKRIGNELRRREQSEKALTQSGYARRALEMRRSSVSASTKPDDATSSEGMRNIPREARAPSGAFDHAGLQPAMQRAKFAR